MTTALDARRGHVAIEAACQTHSVLEMLLAEVDGGPLVRSLLLRLLALSGATMRLFDEMEDDVGSLETIVFGEVRKLKEETAPA